jgi:Type I phosphodiesterase / nucleotide pyrophosphatase
MEIIPSVLTLRPRKNMRFYSIRFDSFLRSVGTSITCGLVAGGLVGSIQQSVATPKVIVVSLDGATPRFVEKYLANGILPPDRGIGLLKHKGVHAERNFTVSPSLTAVGHIAIATGSTAAHNDIAANTFHLVASPFLTTISGFGAPIGGYQIAGPAITDNPTAEPIWVALRQAGKKVVCATFPGADGLDVLVPGTNGGVVQPSSERTVDYTVPFRESSSVFEKGFTLTANDFGPAPQSTIDQLNQAGIKFFQVKQKASALDTFFLPDLAG